MRPSLPGPALQGPALNSGGTDTVIVLAKSPRPGRIKTRLTPTFSAAEAAALGAASLRDTLDTVGAAGPLRQVVAWDGPRVPWLPGTATVLAQRGDGLDERLENAFADVLGGEQDRPTMLIGMDTPQVRPEDLDVEWGDADAVLGLCEDGGYWALGLRRYREGVVRGVPMSTPSTGARQLARLRHLGLRVDLLPMMRDVDTPADAEAVAALAPDLRFARLHRRIVGRPCSPATLFDAALEGAAVSVHDPQTSPARAVPLAVKDWLTMRPADELLVSRCEPPVLDIGCGPGRFVESLASRGLAALGVDASSRAVAETSSRGGCVLLRTIDDRLPAEGRWGTVLLADGNVGIGGDPRRLLRRCRALLRPGGVALVEADPADDVSTRTSLTLHGPYGRVSVPLPWARIGSRPLVSLAGEAGFVAVEDWRVDGRVFLALRHAG